MNKNIKFIVPATLIGCFALTSCGGANGHLKRETYKKVDTLTELTSTMDAMKAKQKTNDGVYDMPEKGTVEMNFNFAISGSVYYHALYPDSTSDVYNFNNINLALTDKITVKWDLNHNYLGVTNKNNESMFITKVDNEWRTYFANPFADKKYYRPLDEGWIKPDPDGYCFKDIKNYLMYAIAENTGFFIINTHDMNSNILTYDINISGLGLGISGFGGNIDEIIGPEDDPDYSSNLTAEHDNINFGVYNYLAPGLLTNDDLDLPPYDETGKGIPVKTVIDQIMAAQTPDSLFPLVANYSKKDDNTGATINLGIDKLNLSKADQIIDELIGELFGATEEVSIEHSASGSGNISLDYFVNFKDNWLHQQELLLDANNANLQLVLSEGYEDFRFYVYIDIKNLVSHGYINETVKLGECDYKEPDIADYTRLDPIPVPEPEK